MNSTERKIDEAALIAFHQALEVGNVERALEAWPGECQLEQSGEQYSVRLSHGLGYSKVRGVGRSLLIAMRRAWEAYEAYRRQWSDRQPLRPVSARACAEHIALASEERATGYVVGSGGRPDERLVTLRLSAECVSRLRMGDRWECVISGPPCVVLRNAMDVTVTYYEADRALPWRVTRPDSTASFTSLAGLLHELVRVGIYPADDEIQAIANLATRAGVSHA